MVIKSGIFNSVNDDRIYYAEDFASYFATFIGNGVFPNPSNGLQVMAGGGLNLILKPGRAWAEGYYIVNTEDYSIPLATPDAVLKRIDRVVVRLNHLTRFMEIDVKRGAYASSPVAPSLTRNSDMYEMGLADIYIGAGQINITQSNITDLRLNKTLCGIVHGTVDQVDTTTIFNQYQAWFNEYSTGKALEFQEWQNRVTSELEAWISAQEASFTEWKNDQELTFVQWSDGRKDAFDVWFATIRGILDQEAAGNIMNVLNGHMDSAVPHKYLDASDGQTYLYGLQRDSVLDTPAFVYGLTETGPHNVIPMPNYQQVEDVKNVVINTGGMLVDINDKKYKAVMHSEVNTKTYYGEDMFKKLEDDWNSKYPNKSNIVLSGYERFHLFNNIHLSIIGLTIVFTDMNTLTVLSSTDVSHTDYAYSVSTPANHFVDSKYIYVRGKPNSNNTLSFAVFDKTTFNFVTAIKLNVPMSSLQEQYIPGEMVLQGDTLIVSSSLNNNVIYALKILYSSGGVPTGMTLDGQGSFGSGGGNPPRIVYGDANYIYIGYELSGTTIEKKRYNKSTKLFENVATNVSSSSSVSSSCVWMERYSVGGVNYILAYLSSKAIVVINEDTMSVFQTVTGPIVNSISPLFDYQNRNRLLIQQTIPAFISLSSKTFEMYNDYKLIDDKWVNTTNFIDTIPMANPDTGLNQYRRYLVLNAKSFIKDGIVYGYRTPYFSGLKGGTFQLVDSSILSHYKEVE